MNNGRMFSFLVLIIIASFCFLASSCVHDLGLPAGTPVVSFDCEVLPLFVNNCTMTGCHDGVSGERPWTVTTYEEVMRGITPGSPDQSHYYLHLIGKSEGLMPPGRPLPLESRSIIRIWILQGAIHTRCPILPPK